MESKFKEKDLVWAKMRGYPPWPAKVERKPRGSKAPNNKFYVMFFGLPHKHAWMAGGDLYAYEEFLEKYNVPRKGLPEAVSEAEEYRAKMRAHRGNKSVASPVQTGVSPGSNTRKRTPASSERGCTKKVKQEMADREEEEEEEEESRESDKQSAREQFAGTPVKLEPGTEPHEDNEKTCPLEERAPPPKRSGRLLKRLSGKKDAANGKRQSVEAAGSGNVEEGEESSVGKKEEAISVPLVQICDLSSNPAPLLATMDNPNALQGTQQAATTPSQGLVNGQTAESMSPSVASYPNSCPTKTEKRRVSNRRKTQSPALSHTHAVSTSSPATELSDAPLLLPPTAKKQCVKEGEGGVLGRAPKPSPERRSTRPRRTPRRLAGEGEEDRGQRDTSEGKVDMTGTTSAGCSSDGVSAQEKCVPTPLLTPPLECFIKISPVGGGRRGRGQGSHKKELQMVNSTEELPHTLPCTVIHSERLQPCETEEVISDGQTVFEELLRTPPCNLPSSDVDLPHSEVCSGSALEAMDQPIAATTRIEEPFEESQGVASQRDQLQEDQRQRLHSPCPATDSKELSTSGCQLEVHSLRKEENHLHKQPVENLSAGQTAVIPLQIELPTTLVNYSTDRDVDDPLTKLSTGENLSADQPSEKHSMEELSIPSVEQTSTKLALDNPPVQLMEESSSQLLVEDPSTKLALDNPPVQLMEESSSQLLVEDPSTKLALDNPPVQLMEESSTQLLVEDPSTKLTLDNPPVQLMEESSTQLLVEDPSTKLALDNPPVQLMEESSTQLLVEDPSTKLALDNPPVQLMEESSTQLLVEDPSTKLALDNPPVQPMEQISIKQALDKPLTQTSGEPSSNDKPTQPVVETSTTKQVLVDSVKQSSPVEHSIVNSLPHQGETLSKGHPLEPPMKRSSQKRLSGRQPLESPSQKQVGGAMEGEDGVDVPSQEKPSRRRSQKELPKRQKTFKSQFQEEPSEEQGDMARPKPRLNAGTLNCLPNSGDVTQSSNGGGGGSLVVVVPTPQQLVHSQCQIVTPPAYTVEQIESGCVLTIDTHLLRDKEGSIVKDTPLSGGDNRVHSLEVQGCAVVSTGAVGSPTPAGEHETVAPQLATDSTPMACSPVPAGDTVAPGTDPSVVACETKGREEERKKKKRHKQKGSVAMCEAPCSSFSQIAVQPGWTSVQCLQVYNYNLKAALVIGSPDIKVALAVMRGIRSLKHTAEDLQKVPDLVATVRKVRHYRDSNKIRNKASELYSELQSLFTQGDSASQGGSNAGSSDGEKATPLDQDRPILWEVIDTNDPAAMKSIKMESEGKPPSPSPRRSQRSSVKNNRVDYSKLLEEDGLDEGDDQLVPMS